MTDEDYEAPEEAADDFYEEGVEMNNYLAKLKGELTSREAFLLFANICVSSFYEDPTNLREIAEETNIDIHAISSSLTREGIDLGSPSLKSIKI